jgi:hypothetical protein
MTQEYGRYFGMKTHCLRGGCLTGPHHSGVELHGLLSYLAKTQLSGGVYRVVSDRGKQVRDNYPQPRRGACGRGGRRRTALW